LTTQPRLNPLTALVTGASGWILVLGLNSPAASLAIIAIALIAGTWRTRNPSLVAATAVLAAPVAVSMLLIHAPYGEHRIAPLLTSDGLADAAHLAARFTALIACLLAAVAWTRTPDLAKALQAAPGGNRLRLYRGHYAAARTPGRANASALSVDANRLKQRPITLKTVVPNLVMPVLTELLTQAGARGQALETAGYDLTGRPHRPAAPSTTAQRNESRASCIPLACVVVVAWI